MNWVFLEVAENFHVVKGNVVDSSSPSTYELDSLIFLYKVCLCCEI